MLISVIIPLFNKEKYVGRAMQSVLNQTHDDFELIIVNDGSTDGSVDEVLKFDDPRIRLIRQENGGVSKARNVGVENSQAEWVAFLDADDEWPPGFLAEVTAAMNTYPSARTIGVNILIKGACESVLISEIKDGVVDDFFVESVRNGCLLTSSSVAVQKHALVQCGGFPEGVPVGEDTDLWARLAWSAPVAFVNDVLAVYNTQAEGNTVSSHYPVRWSYPAVFKTYRQWRKAGKIDPGMDESSRLFVGDAILYYLGNVRNKNGRKWFCLIMILVRFRYTFLLPQKSLELIARCLPKCGLRVTFKALSMFVYRYARFSKVGIS